MFDDPLGACLIGASVLLLIALIVAVALGIAGVIPADTSCIR